MTRNRRCIPILAVALWCAVPLAAQVTGTLGVNEQRLRGTDPNGDVLLFAPDPVQLGSSVSHWDSSASPNLLMEPAINPDLPFLGVDITTGQLLDIGWAEGTSTFSIIDLDPPGSGFTDPTPFSGAPGNAATTLGEARVNVFNNLLATWASTLESPVDVEVEVTWQPLPCGSGGAVLAGASTILIFRGDSFPEADTWYHSGLAESLVGENLSDTDGDILVIVNSDIDLECLGPTTGYYYGLDGNNPPNMVDLAPVVLHEVAHGLGFSNFSNEANGQLIGGAPSIFDHFTFDTTVGKAWKDMSDAERVASAVNTGNLVWSGAQANDLAASFLDTGVPELVVDAPAEVAGVYELGLAGFGPALDESLSGELVCLLDTTDLGPDDTVTDGCSPATNADEVAGKIALIDRGACNFTDKVLNAQEAGAIAAVIVNNAGNSPISLGGDPNLPIGIPAFGLGQGDGEVLKAAACDLDGVFLNQGRFRVTADWADSSGNSGTASGMNFTDETGYFYFFDPGNIELVVKILDACTLQEFENFWVFAAGLTDVEVTLVVTDTASNETRTYVNPLGQAFLPIQDTGSFRTCP